ncbi:Ppx/GppA phosphatase family protein [Prochlorococcus sp. MIT 1300]|uniref:Ppx/GppA phosphatase family protein n=1 Tax=Prochlorococcus sp. MIT 1300 TaxID=3096218 RepID=UPI002A74BEA8|nr:Ppx/GppA phosphatase family protein [Prochlorococcus sp. MIT 1300]
MSEVEPFHREGPDTISQEYRFLKKNQELRAGSHLIQVAAIDIGTNSTHLLIASVDPSLHTFNVDLAEKSTTRLGECDLDTGNLSEVSMQRVLDVLKRFKELADSHQVEQLIVTATSAVREAPNGLFFLKRIDDELNLAVDLISGAEEARLIYLGVLSGKSFGERPHFLLDIGGGSTELILADEIDARALTSTRVGAVRLQRDFIKEEPISINRRKFLKTFIQGSMEPAIDKVLSRVNSEDSPVMVATSGTAMAIGSLIAAEEEHPPVKLHGYSLSVNQVERLIEKLVEMTPEDRRSLAAINDRRAEIIVPGALILHTTMKMLGVKELTLSERALREGLIVDWMLRRGLLEDRFNFQRSIRNRTVLHQVKRFRVNTVRAERVAKHAMSIYDNTFGALHDDKGFGRELLWAASMLHSCGLHINRTAYHKHSWYLIRHGELLGYSHREHLMVAGIARYHRKSLPKKRHEAWQVLASKSDRKLVLEMSLILRLSVALDLRPEPAAIDININKMKQKIIIQLIAKAESNDLGLEQWNLASCNPIVKELTGLELDIQVKT